MTGITRRFVIPLGLAALFPAVRLPPPVEGGSGGRRAGGRCKKQRRNVQDRFGTGGVCTSDRNAIYVTIANYFEDQSTVSVTLTPASGNPQVLTPEDFASALATSIVENGAPICRNA